MVKVDGWRINEFQSSNLTISKFYMVGYFRNGSGNISDTIKTRVEILSIFLVHFITAKIIVYSFIACWIPKNCVSLIPVKYIWSSQNFQKLIQNFFAFLQLVPSYK